MQGGGGEGDEEEKGLLDFLFCKYLCQGCYVLGLVYLFGSLFVD